MTEDTAIGGEQARFPETRHSAIQGTQDRDALVRRQSYEKIVAAYWKPIYKYLRLRWNESNEQAKDLTQGFFAEALERETLTRYDPARASFRTYLRTCLDAFVLNSRKYDNRLKRGAGLASLPLDFDAAEGELHHSNGRGPSVDLDEIFHREWVRGVFDLSIDQLRRECLLGGKDLQFRAFEAYDLCDDQARPTYDQLARQLGLTPVAVTNHLAAMRRSLRKTVLAKLRELTATDKEFRSEARSLFGVDPP